MLENIIFQEIDKSVLDYCVDVYIDTFSVAPWNDVIESREVVVNFFNNHFDNNYCLTYGAFNENGLIGFSLGFKKPWIDGIEYYIDQYCILPEHQSQGIGSAFMNYITTDIKEKGMNAIMLNTEKGFPSEHFYKSQGFFPLVELLILAKGV